MSDTLVTTKAGRPIVKRQAAPSVSAIPDMAFGQAELNYYSAKQLHAALMGLACLLPAQKRGK